MENLKNPTNKTLDDLNLKDIIDFFWASKKVIILTTLVFSIFSVVYSLSIPNKFTSSSVLKLSKEVDSSSNNLFSQYGNLANMAGINLPTGSGNMSDFVVAKILSKDFFKHLNGFPDITEKILAIDFYDQENKRIVFDPKKYDSEKKIWLRNPPKGREVYPSYLEVYETVLKKHLKISKDNKTDFISISFTHESPYFAYSFLTLLINELNSISRKNDLRKSESALVYLKDQLENTSEVDIRDSINILIESELKVQMYANINENYLITPIDPPYFPEVKSEPTRSIICIIGALIGFLVGLLISLLLPIYSKKNKVETSLK